ncbi:hypothetical protein B0J18DRAFT_443023 [Chaetomium sp. MPI-SDFR-AT-0129]|nr:hypothetical protein B0J18DRAFT_443023 [Chaetomium sp. MPI-SDFR-AT-0129]
MKSTLAILSCAAAARATGAETCCAQLQHTLSTKIILPDQSAYNTTENSYWSLQEANLQPGCILRPSSPQDVAKAVSIIVGVDGCTFAIKGQGHAPAAGFANIDGGVTFDMTSLDSTVLSHDQSVLSVGAGASWLQVYEYLDPYNLAVAGGRNGLVGVGGLTPGGGISHFSPRVGWACDNVVNFERKAVFQAFTDIVAAPEFDVDTSLVTVLLYNSTSKAWVISNSAVYTQPVVDPPVFAELAAVPSVSNSSEITSLATYAKEAATPPLNWLFATATFKPSAKFMLDIFDILNGTLYSFNPEGGIVWSIALEPLPAVLVSHAAKTGGNVLGVSPDDGNNYVMLLSALWPNSAYNPTVDRISRETVAKIESRARAKGLLQKFQYINYAAPYQKPLASYGAKNIAFLKGVSKRYDPEGVFQTRVPGGFKLA